MSNARHGIRALLLGLALAMPAVAQTRDLSPPIHTALIEAADDARRGVLELRAGDRPIVLATVIDAAGHAVTKASELPADLGEVTAVLPGGDRVQFLMIGMDKPNDLALLRIDVGREQVAPVTWAQRDAAGELTRVGRIVISPGRDKAVVGSGIVSVDERAIPKRQVLLGVELVRADDQPRVRRLLPGMGAEAAGMKPGDIITHVGDSPTASREDVLRQLNGMTLGDKVSVRVQRDGQSLTFEVAVAPLPADVRDRAEHMNRMGGPLSERADGFVRIIQHDTVLTPQQVGGPLVDVDGKVIGINIARAGRVASYALPADLVQQVVAEITR